MEFFLENKYPKTWESLTLPPLYLNQVSEFGSINIFNDKNECIASGWFKFIISPKIIVLENLGEERKAFLENTRILDFIYQISSKNKFSVSKSIFLNNGKTLQLEFLEEEHKNYTLLTLTKPNPDLCKFTILNSYSFPGFWTIDTDGFWGKSFSVSLVVSSAGYEIILENDLHMWKQWGEILPFYEGSTEWIITLLTSLNYKFIQKDPCQFQLESLSQFLQLADLFTERDNTKK
ncbi:MAG TPA: hypothetical protein PK079_15940 [Leptospiraceae bacterium]|nr:hypothetical protein [Leptospiraceae bacterium]HMX33121.1 hypothetical protein [Leptospiraceae bacterium]HMY34002.1 hypothetical protein [Leptospiraceae bacterium]HMZ63070.1 hypothetical protein [Leptospiraceae bacterium]HNA09474.1 hypothetical protein [Leptospiraceae bacterium]